MKDMAGGSRPAMQRRSQATRDRIVAALERLLRDRRFADIAVGELAEAAGVSPAAIYRRFAGGLPAVLFALCETIIAQRAASPEVRVALGPDTSLRAAMHQIVRIAWEQLRAHAHVYRAAYLLARLQPELADLELTRAFEAQTRENLRILIAAMPGEVKRADTERAAQAVAHFLQTALLERALFPDHAPHWPDEAEFAAEMAEFAHGYLTTSGGAA